MQEKNTIVKARRNEAMEKQSKPTIVRVGLYIYFSVGGFYFDSRPCEPISM